MWYPKAERYSTPWTYGRLDAVAVICHRTYGREAGDMAVALGKARKGISFHFYVTKRGAVRQFVATNVKAAHCKGANNWALGIEVESLNNDDPMTDSQLTALAGLVQWLNATLKLPYRYDPGPKRLGRRPGFIAHAAIAGSDHGDKWQVGEWNALMRRIGPVPDPTVVVPLVIGDNVYDAAAELSAAGLNCSRRRVRHGLVADQVVSAAPPAGRRVPRGANIELIVDEGPAMNVVDYNDQMHTFASQDGRLVHRWWDGRRWNRQVVAGPGSVTSANNPVPDTLPTAVVKYGQLHVFVDAVHAWYDPQSSKWNGEVLP